MPDAGGNAAVGSSPGGVAPERSGSVGAAVGRGDRLHDGQAKTGAGAPVGPRRVPAHEPLEQGRLQVLQPDGTTVQVASGVSEAAVAPGGGRLAYVLHDPVGPERSSEVDGFDVALRTRYRLQTESDAIDSLA